MEIGKQGPATASGARPGERSIGEISAVEQQVDRKPADPACRAQIANAGRQRWLPACRVEVTIGKREPGPCVDPLAFQWDFRRPYVWQITDGQGAQCRCRHHSAHSDFVLVKLIDGRRPSRTEGRARAQAGCHCSLLLAAVKQPGGNDGQGSNQKADSPAVDEEKAGWNGA